MLLFCSSLIQNYCLMHLHLYVCLLLSYYSLLLLRYCAFMLLRLFKSVKKHLSEPSQDAKGLQQTFAINFLATLAIKN